MSWTLLSPYLCALALAAPDYAVDQHLVANGPQGLAHPVVAWALELTPEQQTELSTIMEEQQLAYIELAFATRPPGTRELAGVARELEALILKWQMEYEMLSTLNVEQLKRVAKPIAMFHMAQLAPQNSADSILFYDPQMVERMRHVA